MDDWWYCVDVIIYIIYIIMGETTIIIISEQKGFVHNYIIRLEETSNSLSKV